MDALMIWKYSNYLSDINAGAGFHFNSNQSRLHTALNIGDSLWLVTRVVVGGVNQYRLAARLVVRSKTINAPNYKYGSYRVWGDVNKSSYFRIEETSEADVYELLRLLEMETGSLADKSRVNLFHGMQTMRSISPKSSRLLESFSAQLPLEMRAYQVIDETKLEKAYASDSPEQLDLLIKEQPVGYGESKKEDIRQAYERNRKLVRDLQNLYKGRCQVTGHDSPVLYGVPTAEAHHVVYRSRGGLDEFENLVLVCPNLHAALHAAEANFDYSKLAFIFPNGRVEPLVINEHLTSRAA